MIKRRLTPRKQPSPAARGTQVAPGLRFLLIILPLGIITFWLGSNIATYHRLTTGPFPQMYCAPPFPLFMEGFRFDEMSPDYRAQYKARAAYFREHPECTPENLELRAMAFRERQQLIAYDVWALLAVLYLDVRLILRRRLITGGRMVRLSLAASLVSGRMLVGMVWLILNPLLAPLSPLLGKLALNYPWVMYLFGGPLPPIIMVLSGSLSIFLVLTTITSLFSLLALPVVMLFNQLNTLVIAQHKQELMGAGVYGWWLQFKYWLSGIPMPLAPQDESKGARFATVQEIDALRRNHLAARGYVLEES